MDNDRFTEQSDKLTSQYVYCMEQVHDGAAPRLYTRIMLTAADKHRKLDEQFYKELEAEYPEKYRKIMQQRRDSAELLRGRAKEDARKVKSEAA
jgi:hypothetical protein